MLYLITSGNYMKIGYSQDIESMCRRMKLYLCHAPDFYLVGVCDGDVDKEFGYHQLYKQKQYNEFTLFDDYIVSLFVSEDSFCVKLTDYAKKKNIKYKYLFDSVYNSMMTNYLLSRGFNQSTNEENKIVLGAEIAKEICDKYYKQLKD